MKNHALRSRSKAARCAWSRNANAAKERKRLAGGQAEIADEPAWINTIPKLEPDAIITISVPGEKYRRSIRIHRMEDGRFLALGKIQAASTMGKRIAMMLDAL